MANGLVLKIDGVVYNVPVLEIERKGDILDLTATRTADGVLHREVIGTYYNYSLKVGQVREFELYDALWDVVTAPVASHMVQLPHESEPVERYFGSCKDNIFFITKDGYRAHGFSCNCIATRPDRPASGNATS